MKTDTKPVLEEGIRAWQQFQSLTKRLLAVPKKELEAQMAKAKKAKQKEQITHKGY